MRSNSASGVSTNPNSHHLLLCFREHKNQITELECVIGKVLAHTRTTAAHVTVRLFFGTPVYKLLIAGQRTFLVTAHICPLSWDKALCMVLIFIAVSGLCFSFLKPLKVVFTYFILLQKDVSKLQLSRFMPCSVTKISSGHQGLSGKLKLFIF